eukprot:TRINITY_DN12631_c0_g1_i11.p1 TRINITY_DN12631_c0_g1~~TRINITY_DN12631_c0_g1_i11.p1  ORF type:complete len:921 (+),score=147.17 TRINITY_DN12631_c0_g1_i11:242-3004(+)
MVSNNEDHHEQNETMTALIAADPSLRACAAAVKDFGQARKWQAAAQMTADMKSRAIEPGTSFCNTVASALSKSQRWKDAVDVISTLQNEAKPSTVSYNILVASQSLAERWARALEMAEQVSAASLRRDETTFNAAAHAAASDGRWKAAAYMATLVCKHRLRIDNVAYNSAIDAMGGAALWRKTCAAIRRMLHSDVQPDTITVNSLVSSCREQWAIVSLLVEEVVGRAVLLNSVSYNAVLACLGAEEAWEGSVFTLGSLASNSLAADTISFNTALATMAAVARWSIALQLTSQAQEKGVKFDDVGKNTLFDALRSSWEWAIVSLSASPPAGLDQMTIAASAVIVACLESEQWVRALALAMAFLEQLVEPDTMLFNSIATACQAGAMWQQASHSFLDMRQRAVGVDLFSMNAVISACQSSWQRAVLCMHRAGRSASLKTDVVTFNSLADALSADGQWRSAVACLACMPCAAVSSFNTVSFNTATKACARASVWTSSLELARAARRYHLRGDAVGCSALMVACVDKRKWQETLRLLHEAQQRREECNRIVCNVAIAACEHSDKVDVGRELLHDLQALPGAGSSSELLWAMARLLVEDSGGLHNTAGDVVARLRSSSSPRELAIVAWSFGMLAVADIEFTAVLLACATPVLAEFSLRDLLKFTWGFVATGVEHPGTTFQLQEELTRRFRLLDVSDHPMHAWNGLADDIRGTLWVFKFAGSLSDSLRSSARQCLRRIGKALDTNAIHLQLPMMTLSRADKPCVASEAEPVAMLELPDRVVSAKPCGWEVWDSAAAYEDLQLSGFMQFLVPPRQYKLVGDRGRRCGFLHRLDIPSSGLILSATTYTAFFDLVGQLTTGEIIRDYLTVCHGWMQRSLSRVEARLYWRGDAATLAGRQGKPSRTRLKVLSQMHLSDIGAALCFVQPLR